MRVSNASYNKLWRSLSNNRDLIFSLTQREIQARFRGTALGLFWLVLHPVLMLAIYTFVFSVIFKARWGQEGGSDTEYALILFVGLIVFNIFAECINRAPTLIVDNVNYVKKVVFPLEILPGIVLGAALFQALVGFGVWVAAHLILFGIPPMTGMLLPFVLLPYLLFIMGLSWFLASFGVFLRDLSQVTGILTTVLLFMSPIFYPISAVPERYHFIYQLNPVTYAVEQARDVLFFGRLPDLIGWALFALVSFLMAGLGYLWFQKTRESFADVL